MMPRKMDVPDEVRARTGLCGCGCGGRTTVATSTDAKAGRWNGYPAPYLRGHHKRVEVPAEVLARTGLCACGCGRETGIATATVARLGRYAGYPVKYALGHPGRPGERTGQWSDSAGYMRTMAPGHPNADANGVITVHRLVMAEKLGRPLLAGETVHHVNGDRADNRPENLQLRQGNHGAGAAYTCNSCGGHDITAVPLA